MAFTSPFGYRKPKPKAKTPQQLLTSLPQWDLNASSVKPGMYDPSIDWQGQQEQLGYGFQFGDPKTGEPGDVHNNLYGQSGDFEGQHFDTPGLLSALQTRRDTALGRGQEDFNRQTADRNTSYQRLGTSQGERARASGVAEGGSLAQALQKRTANQTHDQAAADTNWRRFQDDTNRQYDTDRGSALASAFTQSTQGQAAHDLFAGVIDPATGQRVGGQLGEAKLASAQAMGTLPTAPPPGMVPSLKTVLRTGSLVGTGLDANSPIYRRPKPKRRP